eukprot:2455806-Amphidinium_carterae.1
MVFSIIQTLSLQESVHMDLSTRFFSVTQHCYKEMAMSITTMLAENQRQKGVASRLEETLDTLNP